MHEILHLCLTLCWVLKMSRYLTESGGLEKHNEKFVARCNDRDISGTDCWHEQSWRGGEWIGRGSLEALLTNHQSRILTLDLQLLTWVSWDWEKFYSLRLISSWFHYIYYYYYYCYICLWIFIHLDPLFEELCFSSPFFLLGSQVFPPSRARLIFSSKGYRS